MASGTTAVTQLKREVIVERTLKRDIAAVHDVRASR